MQAISVDNLLLRRYVSSMQMTWPGTWDDGLVKAATAVRSVSELSRRLQTSRGTLYRWRRVPAERVTEVERVTGVPRHELRPDVFDGYRRDELSQDRQS